jgi:putative endonuclease
MTLRSVLERILDVLRRRERKYRGLRGVGQEWERLAERHLKEAGYRIRARNYRTRVGEIDFVAQDGDVICFVEVKGRHGTGFGLPRRRSTPKSSGGSSGRPRLLQRERRRRPCRFDVVSILQDDSASNVTIFRDAFRAARPRPRR